ncbi:hypothetical protein RIF29_23247 [Crotalaria pallida]|uniref:RING-type domain-containing protein n=1 Tax=Crotalaria pallida TaxID=3830 RepID=A0AAN9F7I7_CROPI
MADSSGENKRDNKNKGKLACPSIVPVADSSSSLIEFPRYEIDLPPDEISQSLNEIDSLEVGLDLDSEESKVRMREIVDWNDPIASRLEELLLSNLQAIFRCAMKRIIEFGYSEEVAQRALPLSRKGLYIHEGDPISNVVNEILNLLRGMDVATPNVLTGKDATTSDVVFENFQHFLRYTMLEMISVLCEVRPSLSISDAMWVLLLCDLNVSLACIVEDCLHVASNEESSGGLSVGQTKSEIQSSDTISTSNSAGKLPNPPNNKSPLASQGAKPQKGNASPLATADGHSGTSLDPSMECKAGSCSKRHNKKEIAALRQKFLHMEKAYRSSGKGSIKAGKLSSISGLVIEKRVKPPSDFHNQQMKCGSSNPTSKKGVHAADATCHVSTKNASTLSAGGISTTLPNTISSSPIVNANISAADATSKPKSSQSPSDAQKILDYCAGIPYDESLGKYVPRDHKDELILNLAPRVKLMQDELQGWSNWANKKVMQVTAKLGKLQPELKMLRKEKEDAGKDIIYFEDNAVKRISEMEYAIENTKKQIEDITSVALIREAENSFLKNELVVAKLLAEKSMTSHQEALEREQITIKKAQSLESENALHREELERHKNKLSNLHKQIDKEKNLLAKVEARVERERVAKEKLLAQAATIKKERKELEERSNAEEDAIRKKAAHNLQQYVEEITRIERELDEIKQKSESEKVATLRKGESTGNKKSGPSQTMVSSQAKSVAGRLRRERECVMCLSKERSVVFLPCAHQVVCTECNKLHEKQGMKDCPCCRTPIQRRIQARFAHQ